MYKSVHERKKCLVNYHKDKKLFMMAKKASYFLLFDIHQTKIIYIILLNAFLGRMNSDIVCAMCIWISYGKSFLSKKLPKKNVNFLNQTLKVHNVKKLKH